VEVFLWWCFCVGVVMFLWWCFCGGVFVLVWWCFCGGVFGVVFLWWCFCVGVVMFLCWCGDVFVVVFLWWCSCGGTSGQHYNCIAEPIVFAQFHQLDHSLFAFVLQYHFGHIVIESTDLYTKFNNIYCSNIRIE